MSGEFLVAATRLRSPSYGKCWSFHLINNSSEPVELAILNEVGYEWGDTGNTTNPETRVGPVAPGTCVEIWRDDDSAAELRIWLKLLIRAGAGTQTLTVEFPKLYLVTRFTVIPVLGKPGILGAGTLS
jgi:hypothetical protein